MTCLIDYPSLQCVLAVNGEVSELGRTHEYLVTSVKAKANACLVCIETIKRNEPVSAQMLT